MAKSPLSVQTKWSNYKEKNPKKVELNELKQNIRRNKLKENDPEYAEVVREAARKRKAAERARKKATKDNPEPSDNESDEVSRKSRRKDKNNDESDSDTNQNDVSQVSDDNGGFKTPKRNRMSSGEFSSDSSVTPSRQYITGLKNRKKNDMKQKRSLQDLIDENDDLKKAQEKHDDILAELDFKIMELEASEERLKQKIEKLEELNNKNNDSWFKLVYKNLNADGKRHVKNAFAVAAPELDTGTISRLRTNTGINFSNPLPDNKETMSELKLKIIEFAENNTIQVPDKKKYAKGIKYRTSSLLCLFNTFESQNPNICTYQTFAKYWPALFVKPSPSEFGTCLCTYCQNIELKVNSLQLRQLVSSHICLENIIEKARDENYDLENQFRAEVDSLADDDKKEIDIAYNQWEKVKQTEVSKNTGRVKGDKMMRQAKHMKAEELGKAVLKEFEQYKQHLERDHIMKAEIKKVRMEANEESDIAVLHIDWAEQHKLTEIKEIQSAYFNGRYTYDIHTGYCYTKEDSHGFASLSDSSDHKAEAIHAALKHKIADLVENGKKRIVICSDSPTSQYRNGKNVYLMKRLAQELKINIRLLFTEAGHGKSPCDGVGGNIKTQVEAAMLASFGQGLLEPIHSVQDVKKVIHEKTNLNYHITIHTQEDIENVKESMPKLGPLVGAMKVHEIFIGEDGVIKKKELPTDTFYKQVTIRETRLRRPETNLEEPQIDSIEDILNVAHIEVPSIRRNRILTEEEIAAQVEQDNEDDDDDY
jgi:hypothetical protein